MSAAVSPAGAPGSAVAMGILEKISEIEKEIARTQKNKGEGRPCGAAPVRAAGGCRRGREGSGPDLGAEWSTSALGAASDLDRQGWGSNPGLPAAGPGELALCPLVAGGGEGRPGGDPTGTASPAAWNR